MVQYPGRQYLCCDCWLLRKLMVPYENDFARDIVIGICVYSWYHWLLVISSSYSSSTPKPKIQIQCLPNFAFESCAPKRKPGKVHSCRGFVTVGNLGYEWWKYVKMATHWLRRLRMVHGQERSIMVSLSLSLPGHPVLETERKTEINHGQSNAYRNWKQGNVMSVMNDGPTARTR